MAQIMPEKAKEVSPKPPYQKSTNTNFIHCIYCDYVTKSQDAFLVHKSKFHEELLVKEGEKSLREGGDKWHGDYIEVYWVGQDWPTPTPEQWRRGKQSVIRLNQLLHPGET